MEIDMQIDKDVPLHSRKRKRGPYKHTQPFYDLFLSMCIGDSTFFQFKSNENRLNMSFRNSMYIMAKTAAKNDGMDAVFTTRLVNENGVAGFRIWRTK